MDHSYEEIRKVVLEVISDGGGSQYNTLKENVAALFEQREGGPPQRGRVTTYLSSASSNLSGRDANLLLEVFWGLFREGIITLGLDDMNREFPWFRVSEFGKRILKNQDPYFFHDVSSYESLIRSRVPNIDPVTLIYLKEAVQAFKTGCVLSSSVMIGVSVEHSFLKLIDTIENNGQHAATFKKVYNERSILRKLNAFKAILINGATVITS